MARNGGAKTLVNSVIDTQGIPLVSEINMKDAEINHLRHALLVEGAVPHRTQRPSTARICHNRFRHQKPMRVAGKSLPHRSNRNTTIGINRSG
jgi:hypothetical protein